MTGLPSRRFRQVPQYDPVAESYERAIVPKFRAVAEWLVETAAPRSGEAVLDLAAGTGGTSRLIAPLLGTSGRLVVSDNSAPMLDVARSVLSGLAGDTRVEYAEADINSLPFADESFDLIVGQFTPVQDSEVALSEALRILKPGGRLVLAFWGPTYTELDLLNRARVRAGLEARANPPVNDVVTRIFNIGFREVDWRVREFANRHENADEYLDYRASFGRPDGVDDELWQRYEAGVEAEVRALATEPDGGFELTGSAVVLNATR
jgi:ubiquinone/menaquinone biosynthesis C-methylase UbiE